MAGASSESAAAPGRGAHERQDQHCQQAADSPVGSFEQCSGAGPASTSDEPAVTDHPQSSLLELAALPTAVPCARLHAKHVLWEWGLHALGDDVELIVSELVTNSLRAVEAVEQRAVPRWSANVPCIELRLYTDGHGEVIVQVWDPVPQPPVRQVPTEEAVDLAESGRGLFLVEMLSKRWGYYPTPAADQVELFALQQRLSELSGSALVEPRCLRSVGKVVWAVMGSTCP